MAGQEECEHTVTEEEEPAYSVAAIDQHDYAIPAVRVDVGEAPIRVVGVPNRSAAIDTEALSTTWTKVLREDLTRARAVLMCSVAFEVAKKNSGGSGAPWPANIALVLTHGDEVWARVSNSTGTLTVITERYASG